MLRILLLVFALLLPAIAAAEKPYVPRFARDEQPAYVVNTMLFCRRPEWPKASLQRGEHGTVTFHITVAPNGETTGIEVAQSSGFPALDKEAAKALALCIFKPGSIDGVPVQSQASMQYVWTLQ